MIEKYYPSKRPARKYPVVTSPFVQSEVDKATRLGLSLDEYRSRVRAVTVASGSCSLWPNQKVVPVNKADREEHGVMTVIGVCRTYDQYGSIEWHDPPFIVALRSGLKQGHVVNCTSGWATPATKTEITELENGC